MPTLPLLEHQRRARGMTQAALARSAGISVPTLGALQRGTGTLRSLRKVPRILDQFPTHLARDWREMTEGRGFLSSTQPATGS